MLLFRIFLIFRRQVVFLDFSKEKGFSIWRKSNPRITDHETNPSHRECMREYLNIVVQFQRSATIDAQFQQQIFAKKRDPVF